MIIGRVFKSRYTELYCIVFCVFVVLAFWGSSAEGDSTSVERLVRSYIEETALSFDSSRPTSNQRMADISMYVGTGGDGLGSPAPSLDAVTVNESAMTAMTPPDEGYLDELGDERSEMTEYVVQEEDLLSFIASDFGVSTDTIVWANKLKDADSISPGQTLRIPPVSGVIHVVQKGDSVASLAKKYAGDEARIIAYNRLPQDGVLETGDEVLIPDGKMSYSAPVAATGTATASRIAASTRQFAHLPDLVGYFTIPTTGRNWGRIHGRNGVDIANSCGTAIYASADGLVRSANTTNSSALSANGGYGNYLVVAHPNGTETLYGHLLANSMLVGANSPVAKGQMIAKIGGKPYTPGAGRSTGCHLHFEVHGAKNPLAK